MREVFLRGRVTAVVFLEGFEKVGTVALEILVAEFAGLALLTFDAVFIRPGTERRARRGPAMGSLAGAEPPVGPRSLKQVAAHRL